MSLLWEGFLVPQTGRMRLRPNSMLLMVLPKTVIYEFVNVLATIIFVRTLVWSFSFKDEVPMSQSPGVITIQLSSRPG